MIIEKSKKVVIEYVHIDFITRKKCKLSFEGEAAGVYIDSYNGVKRISELPSSLKISEIEARLYAGNLTIDFTGIIKTSDTDFWFSRGRILKF